MKKALIIIGCVVLYLATSIPVGLFLYSLKMDHGVNVFERTGFHGFVACLESEGRKAFVSDADDPLAGTIYEQKHDQENE